LQPKRDGGRSTSAEQSIRDDWTAAVNPAINAVPNR
jgi:hypothetical protein